MLWIAAKLPKLSLEVLFRGEAEQIPAAVSEQKGARRWVHQCNHTATDRGIKPRMPAGAAYALAADLRLQQRDPTCEQQALRRVAGWSYRYSHQVSVISEDAVVLEAGGSQRLLGDAGYQAEQLESELKQMGHQALTAVAPTPSAALLLSHLGQGHNVDNCEQLTRLLGPLPLHRTTLPASVVKGLKGAGFRSLGELLKLPRASVAKRYGGETLRWMDRLLGREADPLPGFTPPESFDSRLVLPEEVEQVNGLLFGIRRLLRELEAFLTARDLGAQRLELQLGHVRGDPTLLPLTLVSPGRQTDYLLRLLRERLDRLSLPAPVEELHLRCDELVQFQALSNDLFTAGASGARSWGELVEKLRARLGADAVCSLRAVAEHRPEYAWDYAEPGEKPQRIHTPASVNHPLSAGTRPLWLLPNPRLVMNAAEGFQFLAGPERIQSGWWDNQRVARDYFVVRTGQGQRLWIYRELTGTRQWYVHGIFA